MPSLGSHMAHARTIAERELDAATQMVGRQQVLDGKCWTTPSVSGGRQFVRSTKEASCLE